MAVHAIDSHPDTTGQFTRLQLDIPDDLTQPLRLNFQLSVGDTFIEVLSARLTLPFLIRIRKYDLANSRMFWGFYDFVATGRPVVTVVSAERKLVLAYTTIAVRHVPPRPTDGSVPAEVPDIPDAVFDSIAVTIMLQAAARDLNHGWIDFDLEHTYPSQIPAEDATFGWEQSVHYPFLDFAGSNPGAFEPVITGPMNFSAVYKATKLTAAVNTATGIGIHVEDVNGNQLEPFYDTVNHSLNYALRNPMHLLGSKFVRAPKYTLSAGDIFGYGGNAIVYRIRAFQASGLAAGAPVGWYDAMEVYRSWLQRHFNAAGETSLFYDKLRPERAKNAPVDQMAPHTVISNYGLDGAVDPGAVGSREEQLSGWLEMHPLRNGAPDTPAAGNNTTFTQLASRLRAKFPNPDDVKLEVQGWGIEQAGFYQLVCGFPPLTNVISGDESKFEAGVNALATNQNTALSITTDPLNTCFNRGRFGGHIRFREDEDWSKVHQTKNWDAMITPQFPASVQNRNCAVTVTKIGTKQFNRVWIVQHFPPVEKVPVSPHTARLLAAQKKNEWGVLSQNPTRTASGLYRSAQKQICPLADVSRIYLEDWVQPWVLDQNVRLLEFMKHGTAQYFCYRADHTHVLAHPHLTLPVNPLYTNVIGYGAWYTRRLQCILFDVHQRGRVFDGDAFCTFRLIHEFLPREALAPYIDEYYTGDEKFDFVYSHLVAHHESPGRGGWGIHPGYKEARKVPGAALRQLEWMLSPDRDGVSAPPKRRDGITKAELKRRQDSFNDWRDRCIAHFNQHFQVDEWGLAPRGYPTANQPGAKPFDPANPLEPTKPPTYTYNRCVQQSFNLRANLFATGTSAVRACGS
ncbi:MAG TPA: hypothetical protein VEK57_15650 [Thermoanaerobaculia bacterium]|nr:hypothetical protein [Thermoanaerobaculia bacterium]